MNEALDNQLTYRSSVWRSRCISTWGPACLKKVCHACLCYGLTQAEIQFKSQTPLPVHYRGTTLDCGYIAGIIVEQRVILELKSVERILPLHEGQLLTYLRLAGCRIGLLINFTVKSGSKATLPMVVMAGAGPPSTTMLLATRKVVDGRPAPAMTRIATVALLADC